MMSIEPAFSFAEPGLVNQLSDFQTGFTPWDFFECSDLFFLIQSSLEPVIPSPCSDVTETGSIGIKTGFDEIKTGSDKFCTGSVKTSSGSDDSDCFHGVPSPNSDELDPKTTITRTNATDHNRNKLNRPVLEITDDRKRKRMESNRESAKRSRIRKQRHIEDLRDEVNQLGLENRELRNRLRFVMHHIEHICTDNDRLLSEQEILRRRFSDMSQILILTQLLNQQQWGYDHQLI